MLCLDSSAQLTPLLGELALKAARTLHQASTLDDALAHARSDAPCAIVIIAAEPGDPAPLELIRVLRELPHRAAVPIAFVMSERDLDLAEQALRCGVTEVFLHEDTDLLARMVLDYAQTNSDEPLSGRLLVVEDSEIYWAHMAELAHEMGLSVDVCASTDAAVALLSRNTYQLALIDVVLDGMHSGLALVRHIRALPPPKSALPILVISSFEDTARRVEALRGGANDFLAKPFADEEFFWRVRRILQLPGEQITSPLLAVDIQSARDDWLERGLSSREIEICERLLLGLPDKQISGELGISFWTVRTHVSSIFAKLELLNRRELLTRYLPGR